MDSLAQQFAVAKHSDAPGALASHAHPDYKFESRLFAVHPLAFAADVDPQPVLLGCVAGGDVRHPGRAIHLPYEFYETKERTEHFRRALVQMVHRLHAFFETKRKRRKKRGRRKHRKNKQ